MHSEVLDKPHAKLTSTLEGTDILGAGNEIKRTCKDIAKCIKIVAACQVTQEFVYMRYDIFISLKMLIYSVITQSIQANVFLYKPQTSVNG